MTNCNYSEHTKIQRKEIQKQIEELQQKLEELENSKSPVEEAYKDWWGEYPSTESVCESEDMRWAGFQAGYNAAYKEPEDTVWKSVALRFGEKLSDIGPCGYYEFSPNEWFEWAVNTYEKLADDWLSLFKKEKLKKEKEWTYKVTDEKGETNPYKQYMNSAKPETLYSLIADWWDEIFMNGNPSGQNIESLVEQIEKWLPKPIDETCGMKDWDNAWTIGYNNYRDTLMEKLK